MSRKPLILRILQSSGLVISSILFSLILLEAILRISDIGNDHFYRFDPVLGVRFIPSKQGVIRGECFRSEVTINSKGWRDIEHSVNKAEGKFRIMVLGDSFMAGLQVNDDETFSRHLEGFFRESDSLPEVDVMNLGVPSFGTDQEYLAFNEYGRKYKPDMVLLAFYPQNDVANNYRVIERRNSVYPKPFFDIEDGRLVKLPFHDETPGWIKLARRISEPFRSYPFIRDRLMGIPAIHNLLFKVGIVGVVPKEEVVNPPVMDTNYPSRWMRQVKVYDRQLSDDWKHAWAITKELILKVRHEVELTGAEFVLVEIATPISALPEKSFEKYFKGAGIENLDINKPTNILSAFSEHNGVNFISLTPVFRNVISGDTNLFSEYYLSCDGHWRSLGHRLAAEAVFSHIRPLVRQQ